MKAKYSVIGRENEVIQEEGREKEGQKTERVSDVPTDWVEVDVTQGLWESNLSVHP